MEEKQKVKKDLDKKFQKVFDTPEGFNFFVMIHDFIEYIESTLESSGVISSNAIFNQRMQISKKYFQLKRIYWALEDINTVQPDDVDLGHERYMAILDLNKIKNKEVSDNNYFWKKRELYRKITDEVYKSLSLDLA